MRRLIGSEQVDPDAGDLPTRIQERLQRLGSDAYDRRRRLDALERDRDGIEADGLSAANDDSRLVYELLREQGLADAQLHGHYLAELVPDVERAKALTLSDPARFSGVLVYSEQELDRAGRLLDQSLGLRAPVVISLPDRQGPSTP